MKISTQMQILVGVAVVLFSYLLGNINNAILISRLKGKDIRLCGSGNPGTMNMLRTYGKALGVLTLILDVVKGIVPALLGWLFMGDGEFLRLGADRIGIFVGGICAALGHIYPVFMKFKGGKAIATIIGVCLVCQPIATVVSFVVGVTFLILTKIGSLTSFIILCAPLTLAGVSSFSAPNGLACTVLVFALFVLTLFAHRNNLVKTFSGNERSVVLFKSKKTKKSVDRSLVFDSVIVCE